MGSIQSGSGARDQSQKFGSLEIGIWILFVIWCLEFVKIKYTDGLKNPLEFYKIFLGHNTRSGLKNPSNAQIQRCPAKRDLQRFY